MFVQNILNYQETLFILRCAQQLITCTQNFKLTFFLKCCCSIDNINHLSNVDSGKLNILLKDLIKIQS